MTDGSWGGTAGSAERDAGMAGGDSVRSMDEAVAGEAQPRRVRTAVHHRRCRAVAVVARCRSTARCRSSISGDAGRHGSLRRQLPLIVVSLGHETKQRARERRG